MMKIKLYKMLGILVLINSYGCLSYFSGEETQEVVEGEEEGDTKLQRHEQKIAETEKSQKVQASQIDSVNKSLAEIKASLERLTRIRQNHSERLRVLEQGMSLGIVPSELKNEFDPNRPLVLGDDGGGNSGIVDQHLDHPSHHSNSATLYKRGQMAKGNKSESEMENLRRLQQGKDVFHQGKYGKALVMFEKLSDDTNNKYKEPVFWIGRSWYELGNFQNAINAFEEYLSSAKTINHRMEATYHLARSELKIGYSEKGITRLQDMIKNNPKSSIADAARLVVASYEQAL